MMHETEPEPSHLKHGDIVEILNLSEDQALRLSNPKIFIGMRYRISHIMDSMRGDLHVLEGFPDFDRNATFFFLEYQLLKIELKPDKNSPWD